MTVHPDKAGTFFYVSQDALRIIFVDDDPILREFAIVNLTTEQAQVETAEDGVAALAAVARQAPDVMLLDLEMPNMDGFEVLQALRADPATRDLPVIVVTGREDVDAVDRAFQAGATSFVVKPINWRLLSYQIRYVCRAALSERAIGDARRDGADQADALGRQLHRLALESARFLAVALAREPRLRPDAVSFAEVAGDVLGGRPDEKAA